MFLVYVCRVSERDRTRTTYFYERCRAPAAGIIETAATLFLLLVAFRSHSSVSLVTADLCCGLSLHQLLSSPDSLACIDRIGWHSSLPCLPLPAPGPHLPPNDHLLDFSRLRHPHDGAAASRVPGQSRVWRAHQWPISLG